MVDIIVQVEQGNLRGKISLDYKGGKFYSFQGIPYAKPPINELRFKAPVSPNAWKGVRDATKEASKSLSRDFMFLDKLVGSEDCLYLNVYTPQLPNEENKILKPVMFWIHGGALVYSSSSTEMYGPEILITGDVVLVTFNYRLGILGFLSVEGPTLDTPGNAGLKDMIMALKWVQKNIEYFGGDSKNVTIFGESAGSAVYFYLRWQKMCMNLDLFHRAILQSACALNPWVYGSKSAIKIAAALGYQSTNEKEVLQFLRSVSAGKILEAQDKLRDTYYFNERRPFAVVVENSTTEPMFFPEHPLELLKSGNYNKVPIMIGFTTREGMLIEMEVFEKLKTNADFEKLIPFFLNVAQGTELSLKIANMIKEAYFGSSSPSQEDIDKLYLLISDVMFVRGLYKTIKMHFETMDRPIYFYIFSVDENLNTVKKLLNINHPGACHGDEIGYLFTSTLISGVKENSIEELIIQRMAKLWTNFAKRGNPNPTENDPLIDVNWKPVKKDQYNCLDIGKRSHLHRKS